MAEAVFWNSSPREIIDYVASYKRRQEKRKKEEINNIFVLARVIVSDLFVDGSHPEPMPWDYYPALFASERAESEQERKTEELEEYKEKRRAYITAFNEKMRAKKGGSL